MDWTRPCFEEITDDRVIELPDLCLRKIVRELIFKNDARNFRRAYSNSAKVQQVFESTWKETVHRMQFMKPVFCPWCIYHFLEKQKSQEEIAWSALLVPNSILSWEKVNDVLWSPKERWRGVWLSNDFTMSSKLTLQCLNHEQYGSSSLHYPYVSTTSCLLIETLAEG